MTQILWHSLSQETAQNPRDAIDSYFRRDAKSAWEARSRIIAEFDNSLDAYVDPFAIEEVGSNGRHSYWPCMPELF